MANIYVYSGAAGSGTGADWTNAYTTLGAAAAAGAAGDTFFVAHDHAESAASAKTITLPGTIASPNLVYSVNRAIASPGGGDLLAGAQITTTGNNAMTVNGSAELFGIRFKVADGTSAPNLTMCGTAGRQVYRQCIVDFTATTGAQTCFIGVNTAETATEVLWTDSCQFLTGSSAQGVTPRNTRWTFENSATPLTTGANGSRNLITNITTETTSIIVLRNLNFASMPAGWGIANQRVTADRILIENCRLPDRVIYHATTPDDVTVSGFTIDVVRCAETSGINWDLRRYADGGSLVTTDLVSRTNGASDGVTSFGWRIDTSAQASWVLPFETPATYEWNTATGASKTITMFGIANTSAIPTNAQLWIEAITLTDASYPVGAMARSARANGLTTAANYSASTEAWGATAPARANSTPYGLGDAIGVASNPGRVFFCTAAGTSSGSEPAGYATAVDGGSVTDGGATFRAGWRFSMSVSQTPQMAGPIQVRVMAAAANTNVFVCPKLSVA